MNLLLAVAIFTAAPTFEVQTLDGQTLVGPLVELTADRLTIDAAGGRTSLDAERLLLVSSRQVPEPKTRKSARVVVELTDGSVVIGRQYVAYDAKATITLTSGELLQASTSIIRTVRLQQPSETPAAEWTRLIDKPLESDVLVVRKKQSIDYHQGVLHDVTEDAVRFEFDGEMLPVKRAKVYGLAYHHTAAAESPPALCRITDAAGSQWSVRSLALKLPPPSGRMAGGNSSLPSPSGRGAGGEGGAANVPRPHPNPLPAGEGTSCSNPLAAGEGTLQWTTPTGLSVAQTADKSVRIDFSGGKVMYLSDMKPVDVRWTPYFAAGLPPPAVAQFYGPRYDRNFDGGPLQLDGTSYRKGLALHSRTEIVYRVPERFTRFRAIAGIDDAVRPGGKVRLVIRGDDRQLLDVSLSGADAARPIDLDLTGVRRLTIVVDFGENVITGDCLLLCNARLSK
jgi:hypothetical protein